MIVSDEKQDIIFTDEDERTLKVDHEYVSDFMFNYVRLVSEKKFDEIISFFDEKVIDKLSVFTSIPCKILSNKTIINIFTDFLYGSPQDEIVLKHRQQIIDLLFNFPREGSVSWFMYENKVVYSMLSRYLSYEEDDLIKILKTVLDLTLCYSSSKFDKLFYDAIHIKILNVMEDVEYHNVDIYLLSSEILVIIFSNFRKYFMPRKMIEPRDSEVLRIVSLLSKFIVYNHPKLLSNTIDVLSYSLELYRFDMGSMNAEINILASIYHKHKDECIDAFIHFLFSVTGVLLREKSITIEGLFNFKLFNDQTVFLLIEDILTLINNRASHIICYFVSTLFRIILKFDFNEHFERYLDRILVIFRDGSFQTKNDMILLLTESLRDENHRSQVFVIEWLFHSLIIKDIIEFCLVQCDATNRLLTNLLRRVFDISYKANINIDSVISVISSQQGFSEILEGMGDPAIELGQISI